MVTEHVREAVRGWETRARTGRAPERDCADAGCHRSGPVSRACPSGHATNSARSLRCHRELLLNYFRARKQFSSGVVEGLNNKCKVTMRKAYGFRTFKATEIALYHVLDQFPEPRLAHAFS